MKQTLLLTSIAILMVMSSCMRDEVVDVNNGHAIGFRTAVETRGMEARNTSLDAIYVTALEDGRDPYFSEVPFTLVGYDEYTSTDSYFWPGQDRKLKFYAYAPDENLLGASVTITNSEKSLKNFVVKENISEQVDFVYAVNEGSENNGLQEQADVSLYFKHKLSRINVQAMTNSDYVYKFAGVRIGSVFGKADLNDLSGVNWSIDETYGKKNYTKELSETEIIEVTKSTGSQNLLGKLLNLNDYAVEDYAFMIPQKFAPWDHKNDKDNQNGGVYIAVKMQVCTSDGVRVFPAETEEYAWVAIPVTGSVVLDETGQSEDGLYQWKGEYAYNYTLDFTYGAGFIEPNIGNLDSGNPVLGDGAVVKLTMTLGEMEEGVENVVVNPNMLGEWTAQKFSLKQVYYEMIVDENEYPIYDEEGNPQFKLDEEGNRIVLWEKLTELEGAETIGPQIDNFAKITILDGMYLWGKDRNGNDTKSRYYVNDENYILVDCYRYDGVEEGSLDQTQYNPAPKIRAIVPASPTSPGYADIIVENTGWGWSDYSNGVEVPYIWEDTMTIWYAIECLNTDSE